MPRWHRISLVVIAVVVVWAVAWTQEGKPERERLQAVVQFVQQLLETGKAIETLREVLHTQSGTAPSAKQVVDILNHLVADMYRAGVYAQGLELAKQTQAYAEAQLGIEHPNTLSSLNNLAFLYQAQGRYGEAEPLFHRALATSERVLGAEHPQTLISLNNLALLYQAQGRYREAEPLYQKALATRERVLGPEHPDTLSGLNNLAALYDSQGRYREAEPLYQKALATRERVLGAEHPYTLGSLNNLASVYWAQGRYGEAEPLFQKALAIRERVLGAEHPDTLRVQLNYAVLLVNRDQPQRALQQLKLLEPRLLAFAGVQLHTTLQEQVRREFLLSQSSFQDDVFTLAVQQKDLPEFRAFAAEVLLRWKQVQRDEDAYLAGLLRTSKDTVLTRLGQEIKDLRRNISHMTNRS
jgi:tetratricopeptide (TPR) repeat protein